MEPKLIKGLHAEYIPAVWSGENTSGVRMVGKTVLVLPDECSPVTSGTAGLALLAEAGITPLSLVSAITGTTLPPELIERMNMAAESGVIVSIAAGAFLLNEDMTPWSGERPKPGDRVYFEKYAGKLVKGSDGATYRIMDYGSIGAVYDAPDARKTQGEAA